ncbi:YtxH domain-containing protein [Agromyces arachidis]|uniref:YtxH domain-containing protein n=1 Tax=Agromyces arachidis TaxID=766966 RepID=UPI0040574175
MKGKFLFVVGLGVGYVLGTRAGRERYEQIRRAAEDVWNQPKVQEGVDTVKDFAMSRVGDVSDAVLDGAKKVVRQISGSQTTTTRSTGSSTGSSSSKSGSSSGSSSRSTTSKSGSSKSGSSKSGSGSSKSGSSSSTSSSGGGSGSSSSS